MFDEEDWELEMYPRAIFYAPLLTLPFDSRGMLERTSVLLPLPSPQEGPALITMSLCAEPENIQHNNDDFDAEKKEVFSYSHRVGRANFKCEATVDGPPNPNALIIHLDGTWTISGNLSAVT